MHDANESAVLGQIGPEDVVLDIGGWARCFNRANYVMDAYPYGRHGRHYLESMGLGPQGGDVEHFTAETWIARDLCDRQPWPFADKSIDYCTCSHVLEDIRDPIWVCSEMNRVAKRGYIEVPSMAFEMSRGREPGVPVGLSHHRWICDLDGSQLVFAPKNHMIHGDRRLSLPAAFGRTLPPEAQVTWLFWEGSFSFREGWLTAADMEAFVRRLVPADEIEVGPADAAPELGPRAIAMARRLRDLSHRHPKAAALLRRLIPAA